MRRNENQNSKLLSGRANFEFRTAAVVGTRISFFEFRFSNFGPYGGRSC
jgi:hypothetical protein